jgi:hypothetical protein
MISDQRQTGVPNAKSFTGSSGRTQLVKPNQVTNVGRSLPQNQNLAPALANTQQTQVQQVTPTFNPVYPQAQTQTAQYDLLAQAKADMAQQQGQTTAVRPQTQSMNDYLKAQAQNPNGAQLAAQVTQEAEQLVQDKDIARQAIRKMKSTDIIELLDELANGTLTGAD